MGTVRRTLALVVMFTLASPVFAQVRTWEYGQLALQRVPTQDYVMYEWRDDPETPWFAGTVGEFCEAAVSALGPPPVDVGFVYESETGCQANPFSTALGIIDLLGAYGWELSAFDRWDAPDGSSFTFYYFRRPVE
jgi:hypothetical protein